MATFGIYGSPTGRLECSEVLAAMAEPVQNCQPSALISSITEMQSTPNSRHT